MINRFGLMSFILVLSLLYSSVSFAHKINVFGYVDQSMVKTESTFSGGRAAQGCQLSMRSGVSSVIVGLTDEKGMLDFPVPTEKVGFDLQVSCGDGHKGTWRIETEELGGVTTEHVHAVPAQNIQSSQDTADIRRVIREELAMELGPIKKQLAALKKESFSLADIMGGIGYFLGLAGLASYMRFRRDNKS